MGGEDGISSQRLPHGLCWAFGFSFMLLLQLLEGTKNRGGREAV